MYRPLSIAALTWLLVSNPVIAAPDAMTASEARHLISRTGFGASPAEITAMTGMSYRDGVAQILDGVREGPDTPMPAWTNGWPYPKDVIWTLGPTATDTFFTMRYVEMEGLQKWWLGEMITTDSPLTERLTLFWHDHFATSFGEVENSHWMADQNALFRRHAAGDFGALAREILRDPATLAYLDNTENIADAPNENLAREYLELFTLGEGRGYTESDVSEAARALTGHGVAELSSPVYHFYGDDHDNGVKTILGETGAHDADDLARIVLNHPDFGPYIVEKLWRNFVSDTPDPAEITRLVALWRANELRIAPLLEALLLTDAFWDPANRGRLIKDPVTLYVGTVRSLGLDVADLREPVWMLDEMGHALFYPPNVGGWPNGVGWVNDASVGQRATMLTTLANWGHAAETRAYVAEKREDAADMMLTLPPPPTPVPAHDLGADDLRVGQSFAVHSYTSADAAHAVLLLYDIGWRGKNWRSIGLSIEQSDDEPLALSIYTGDCAPECLPSLPWQDDNWVYVPAVIEDTDDFDSVSPKDAALMAALTAHLPELIASTESHRVWSATDGGDAPPDIGAVIALGEAMRLRAVETFGKTKGDLVLALGPRGDLGLGPLQGYVDQVVENGDDSDLSFDLYEAIALSQNSAVTPPTVYADATTWLAALNSTGLESARAEEALLAVPLPAQGRRMSLTEDDPEALVRSLVRHPHFQVN